MGHVFLFLLVLVQMQAALRGDIVETPNLNTLVGADTFGELLEAAPPANYNSDEESKQNDLEGQMPYVSNALDQTELEFKYPIKSIGIDYTKNVITLRFQKNSSKYRNKYNVLADEKRKALEKNFMRFGKRQMEQLPAVNSNDQEELYAVEEPFQRFTRSSTRGRDSRGDNFMRFGRSAQDFMRFGRSAKEDFMRFGRDPKQDFMHFGRNPKQDFMRFGRDPKQDFMRFGRDPKQNFMRFGRNPKQDFMRFGRDPKQDFMRFGRSPKQDFMRFGRDPKQDFMRFGRDPNQDFMRFGRGPKQDFMRFGRSQKSQQQRSVDKNFMRFGRPDNLMRFGRTQNAPEPIDKSANFMRFGKSLDHAVQDSNQTKPLLPKSDIKESAKLMRQTSNEHDADESNPMDKAINALYHKQQQQQEEQQPQLQLSVDDQNENGPNASNNNDDFSAEQYYAI